MDLKSFDNADFDRGASRAKELVWLVVSALTVAGPLPGSGWRAALLRAFGAEIGPGVVLKPGLRVKFPWRLTIGDNSWIGESAWIDNLDEVRIGRDTCISQGAYLGTGNHDWTSPAFDLVTAPVRIGDQCWVGARATVAPGTRMEDGAVLGMGAAGKGRLAGWTIHAAAGTREIGPRRERARK
ncbi:MAG: WcaF family extracellular polysaccharide biosynthesis acetyltransferase [Maritimibacter sp.]|nr:WcaF family extracellular polysaccharide biosynthesis acetyltransferase [Maritimibacter sp.]